MISTLIKTSINTMQNCVMLGAKVNQNPLDTIISWMNLLTNSSNTAYDGNTPTNAEIEASADLINGQII